MDSILCIGVGILAIVTRGPLIVAPRATLRFYRNLLSSEARIRVLGAAFAALAVILLVSDFGEGELDRLFKAGGWLMAACAFLFAVLPNFFLQFFQSILRYIEHSVSDGIVRTVGALAVLIGVVLIYVGFTMI